MAKAKEMMERFLLVEDIKSAKAGERAMFFQSNGWTTEAYLKARRKHEKLLLSQRIRAASSMGILVCGMVILARVAGG